MTDTPPIDSGEIKMKAKTGPKPRVPVMIAKPHMVCGYGKVPVDPERVYDLAFHGCHDTEIGIAVGIEEHTLRNNFRDELAKGRQQMKEKLRRAQMRVATETGNPTMLIWLGKQMLKQSDTPTTESNKILPWSDDD
jgi:hypothetical protein